MLAFVTPAAAPAEKGAYALLIALQEPLLAKAGGHAGVLSPGRYIYCGSANGPGGLRARIARHARKEKRAHWHIDQLTAAGDLLGAWVAVGGFECALNAELGALPIPLKGFGSSDCPHCESHLRLWPKSAALPSRWESARAHSAKVNVLLR
jgi:Uri superfamily endonuclease